MQLQPTFYKFLRQLNQKKNQTAVQSGSVPVFLVHRTGPLIPRHGLHSRRCIMMEWSIHFLFSFLFYSWNIFLYLHFISSTLWYILLFCHKSVSSGGCVEFSDKTLYFAFCDTQSHAVTMTTSVLHSYIIYLPPLIVISILAYVWCTFEILIWYSSTFFHTLRVLATVVP